MLQMWVPPHCREQPPAHRDRLQPGVVRVLVPAPPRRPDHPPARWRLALARDPVRSRRAADAHDTRQLLLAFIVQVHALGKGREASRLSGALTKTRIQNPAGHYQPIRKMTSSHSHAASMLYSKVMSFAELI